MKNLSENRLETLFRGSITIRYMNVSDIPGVARAHVAAWQAAFRGILSDALLDSLSVGQFEATWREIIWRENRTNLVADQTGEILGYIAFGPAHEPDLGVPQPGEIIAIYVHPDHWRLGAGCYLLRRAMQDLKRQGCTRVVVWTMADNAISRAFYQKNGFVVDGSERLSERRGEQFREIRSGNYLAQKRSYNAFVRPLYCINLCAASSSPAV